MNLKVVGIAFITLALVACSTQPTQPSARAPAPTPAPAAVAAPAPAAAPAAAAASSTSAAAANPVPAVVPGANGNAPVLNRTLIQAGYKATNIQGEVFYCRQELVTGTGFKRKVCLNEAQLREEERKVKEIQDRMMGTQASPSCLGPTC